MAKTGNEPARRTAATVDNPSTAWINEVELNSRALQQTARRVGLGKGQGSVKLSLQTVDRRRIQIWSLTIALLMLVFASMTLVSGVFDIPLPSWLPRHWVVASIFVLTLLYGIYVFEKESQLRKLTRFLVDEQFQTDVVNRRLKVVETLLESSKAATRDLGEKRALDIVSRQAKLFFEDGDLCVYLRQDESAPSPASGNLELGLDELAKVVAGGNQSQFTRLSDGEGALGFGVPIAAGNKVFGALCLKIPSAGIDTFETLMTMSLFAEQAAAAIANSRSRERERLEESRLEYASTHDSQTGLLNRERFIERVDRRISEFGEDAPRIAVMFFNIDDLHRINNSLGYDVGDAVIRHYGEVLHENLPPGGLAGHFGGDEFMVALLDITGYGEALEAANALRLHLEEPSTIANRKVWTSTSIGVAMPETWQTNARDLIRDAHIAMQKAKESGGATVSRFDANLHDEAERALGLEEDLRRALDHDEITINLQPIFDLESMNPVAVEALVRWQHPEHGVLPASSFLPFAGRTGQLKLIDQRVFQKSCAAIRGLRDHGFDIPVHANLFPGYLTARDLVPGVKRILDAAGIDPSSFVIEISDTDVLMSNEQAARNLARLKDMGFGIALDDFGSGASGLESLNKTRIDAVKISRSFVASLGDLDNPHHEMVETIVSLAARLNLQVVAVGVENDHQLELLKDLGCRLGQGHFLGKPLLLKGFVEAYAKGGNPETIPNRSQVDS